MSQKYIIERVFHEPNRAKTYSDLMISHIKKIGVLKFWERWREDNGKYTLLIKKTFNDILT